MTDNFGRRYRELSKLPASDIQGRLSDTAGENLPKGVRQYRRMLKAVLPDAEIREEHARNRSKAGYEESKKGYSRPYEPDIDLRNAVEDQIVKKLEGGWVVKRIFSYTGAMFKIENANKGVYEEVSRRYGGMEANFHAAVNQAQNWRPPFRGSTPSWAQW
jgi:hypothetical protein